MATPIRKPRESSGIQLRTICESCGIPLLVDARDSGKKATCPECGGSFIIPSDEDSTLREIPMRKPVRVVQQKGLRLRDELKGRPPAPTAQRKDDERKAPQPQRPAAQGSPQAKPHVQYVTSESHRARAQLCGWLRRVIVIFIAFAVVMIFEAAFYAMRAGGPTDLHSTAAWIVSAVRGIPASLQLAMQERTVTLGVMTGLERFMLALGMLLYATRMVVRTKLIDAVYVNTRRWNERTVVGLVMSFFGLLFVSGLLAWAASLARIPGASDGLTCGVISLLLFTSCCWLLALHLMAGNEYPELTKWMMVDAVSAGLILLVVLWPGLTVLWSRAGASAVIFLANSAAALHVGASFVFVKRKPKWWWHKPVSILVSISLLMVAAALLACNR